MNDLKPCPLCGGEAWHDTVNGEVWCGRHGCTMSYRPLARITWQSIPRASDYTEQIERLTRERDEALAWGARMEDAYTTEMANEASACLQRDAVRAELLERCEATDRLFHVLGLVAKLGNDGDV